MAVSRRGGRFHLKEKASWEDVESDANEHKVYIRDLDIENHQMMSNIFDIRTRLKRTNCQIVDNIE